MPDNTVIRCYTCRHRFDTGTDGYNQYCEEHCGDGACYKGYEPDEEASE